MEPKHALILLIRLGLVVAGCAGPAGRAAPADAKSARRATVVLTREAVDESAGGVLCYKIETPVATYFLEKSGFGLSSMVDRDGRDWISFSSAKGSRGLGNYRGFPNAVFKEAGNYFHPRWEGTEPSTSRVDFAGDERVTISADSENGLWGCRFDFFPTHCTFTMTRKPPDHPYWVLYEGAPGGTYEDTDWWIASGDTERHPMTVNHEGDLPAPEWIAFGDPRLDRVFFLLHHEDDDQPDRFYQMEHTMTVFGFGREGMKKFLTTVPQRVSIGFIETTDPKAIQERMQRLVALPAAPSPSAAAAPAPSPANFARFTHRAISPFIGHTKVADMDGDGRNDIAFHMHVDATNIKQPGRKTGLAYLRWPDFTSVPVFEGEVTGDRFAAVDVNGDGRVDFVSGKFLPGGERSMFWYENPGKAAAGASAQTWPEHLIGRLPKGWIKDVAAADIDGDGRLDVAVRQQENTLLFFQGLGGWQAKQLDHVQREGLALVDLDRDGDLDVVLNGFWFETPVDPLVGDYARHEIDPKWFNQKTGQWPDNAAYVGSADFNRDGLPDIVFAHSEKVGYPISWYSVKSRTEVRTGPWQEHTIAEVFDWCETVDIGDVDNDGTLDVLAAKFQRHDPPGGRNANVAPFPVTIFYNVAGDGSKWRREDIALDGVYAAALGDVGSDGDLDIVGPQSYWKGPIRLWENHTRDRPLPITNPKPRGAKP